MSVILLQSLLAGFGTCLGAGLVILFGQMGHRTLSLLLGFASGVMAAVVLLDLLPTSLHYGYPLPAMGGFMLGFSLVAGLDYALVRLLPGQKSQRLFLRMGYLIALGIAMHDLPEGIAIAAGYAASTTLGPLLALAIGLHNVPEGMATAAPLRAGGVTPARILAINVLVSLVTPLGTLVGLFILRASPALDAMLLALAAGAMIYIVLGKLIPASLGSHGPTALAGLGVGFVFMLQLNLLF